METQRFEAFCQEHLSHLDEVVLDYFGTPRAKDVVQQKVKALFPPHEVDRFTDHFYGLVQFWRKTETERLATRRAPAQAGRQETTKIKLVRNT